MNEELMTRATAPMELPPPPEPHPDSDPIANAVIDEIVQEGYEKASIAGVVRRARLRRADFDRRYDSLDACALDSYERFSALFRWQVGRAFNEQGEWPAGLRAAAYACADFLSERPALMAFGAAEILKSPSELIRVRREELLAFCSEMIDRGREAAPEPASIPELAPVMAIGGIAQLLTHRVQEGAEVEPHEVVPEMMNRIVTIYLGAEAAEAEWNAPRLSAVR